MDRQTTYSGQVTRSLDGLLAQQNAMIGLAKMAAAVFGTNTLCDAFTVTPTAPASLNVLLTAGSIYQIENLEATIWSSVSVDTAHSIFKQGILLDPVQIGITPPGTTGFSQNFLIEVQYQDLDTGSLVLPYYNAANPTQPFSGPANAGTAQNTIRKGIVAFQAKAGVAAPTGTQTTPTADAGWTGIYVVTVANGQATITAGNITRLASAPFLPTNGYLPQIPFGVQQNSWTYVADNSVSANTILAQLSPAPTSYTTGMMLMVKLANTLTNAAIINVNNLGNKNIVRYDGTSLSAGDGVANQILGLIYDGANFQIAWRSGMSDIIDTAVTFTVHGTNPNFTDLNAAMEYLTKFKIARQGSVTLQIAGAGSGSAQQFTYSSQLILDHPNMDKITIQGVNLIGTAPTDTNFVFTGVLATDQANALTMLRGVYGTELHFTGGSNIVSYGSPTFKNLLISGDGSALPNLLGVNSGGFAFVGGVPQLNNVSVHGFGGIGYVLNNAYLVLSGACVSSSGNNGPGFELQASTMFPASTETISAFNSGDGFSMQAGTTLIAGSVVAKGNTGSGINGIAYNVNCANSKFLNNTGWGVIGNGGVSCSVQSSTWSSNGSGSAIAGFESVIIVTGATGLGAISPTPAGTIGNSNSIVVN